VVLGLLISGFVWGVVWGFVLLCVNVCFCFFTLDLVCMLVLGGFELVFQVWVLGLKIAVVVLINWWVLLVWLLLVVAGRVDLFRLSSFSVWVWVLVSLERCVGMYPLCAF